MKENKTYTSDDFERYYSGKMTVGEMHEIEERALEDPFLADALEGYEFTKSPSKDMAGLRSKILKNPKEPANIFTIRRNNNWLRIAAVLLLVTGASLIFYKINLNSSTKTLAGSEMQKSHAADSVSLLAKIDSPANDNMAFQQESPKPSSEKKVSTSTDKTIKEENATTIKKKQEEKKSSGKVEVIKVDGKSQDENESSIEVASIKSERAADKNAAANKKLMIARNDEAKAQKYNDTVGYLEAKPKSRKEIATRSEVDKAAPSPTVLLRNIDQSSQIKSLLVQANSKVDGQQLSSGNKQFDEYLKSNLQPVLYNNTRQTGVVVLSFVTDSTGKSGDIKIAYSSCPVCENQASDLLQKGPLWGENRNNELVLIKFY